MIRSLFSHHPWSALFWLCVSAAGLSSCALKVNQTEAEITLSDGTLALNAPSISVTMHSGQTFQYSATGGSSPYRFMILSGPGSIDPHSGLFTAGARAEDAVVQVIDSAGGSARSTVHHNVVPVSGHDITNSYSAKSIAVDSQGNQYIGGVFVGVHPYLTQGVTKLEPSSGTPDLSFDTRMGFNGTVNAAVPLSNGGWVVGGSFTKYQGVAAGKIAKLDRYGNLDTTFNGDGVGFSSIVYALAVDEAHSVVYVGGLFTKYRGVTNSAFRVAKLSLTDGSISTTFHPISATGGFDAQVSALSISPDGNSLYAGGAFSTYRGVANSARKIAKIATSDGTLDTTFHPVSATGGFGSTVNTLLLNSSGSTLYVGGSFTTYRGVADSAYRIAKLSTTDGSLDTTFQPNSASGGFSSGSVAALALDSSETKLYVGGNFSTYRGVANSARGIAKLSSADGSIDTTFHPVSASGGFSGSVYSVVLSTDETSLFIGGDFYTYRGVSNSAYFIAKVDTTSGNNDTTFHPISTASGFDSYVRVIVKSSASQHLFVGGDFHSYRPLLGAGGIAKFDRTGKVDTTFHGDGSGFGYLATINTVVLDPSESNLYVGGIFTQYRGVSNAARFIAKLSTTDGSIDATFHPVSATGGFNGSVEALAIDPTGTSLYAGGQFTAYRGVANSARRIAKLATADGSIDTTFHPVSATGGFNQFVYALAVDSTGANLYVGGVFSTYQGVANSARAIAKLSTANGALDTTFHPNSASGGFDVTVQALALDSAHSILYVGGSFTSYRGVADSAHAIAKLSTADGSIDTTFHPVSTSGGFQGTGTTVLALALSSNGGTLYAGGYLTQYRGVTNSAISIAKLDTSTGAIDSTFHPVSSSGGFQGTVYSLALDSSHDALYAGGEFFSYRTTNACTVGVLNPTTGAFTTP